MTMSSPASLAGQRCVVVGGAGAVGGMFVDHLQRSGAQICIVDTVAPRPECYGEHTRFEQSDITNICSELATELGLADLVLLAVPEPVALAAIQQVVDALRPGALLIDTLSVKGPIADSFCTQTAEVELVSLNPMFAPSLDIDGRPIAVVVVHGGPRAKAFLRLLKTWGARVVVVTKDEHDRLAAATQALTHAAVLSFGLALTSLELEITELSAVAPPPHLTLLALLARIASGTTDTYWDVQAANLQAPRARMALASGIRRLADLVEDHDKDGFITALHQLQGFFGADLHRYRNICARTFESMRNVEDGGRDQ